MSAKRSSQNPPEADDVGAALNLLRDALSEEAQRINEEGAAAMKAGDYPTAEGVLEFAKRLVAFRSKVEGLGLEWSELEGLRDKSSLEVQEIVSKRFFGRKQSGEITPFQNFCRPLLEVLVEMGGRGKAKDVLDRLVEEMKDTLKPKDYELHESDAKQIRWRNTAQWARNRMVNEDGRMKKSPQGIWEISDAGRKWLKKVSNEKKAAWKKTSTTTPVAFHASCLQIVSTCLKQIFIKQTRSSYLSQEADTALVCAVSREHDNGSARFFWYAFHPYQEKFLASTKRGYLLLGCGSSEVLLLIPYSDFAPFIKKLNRTNREDGFYSHIRIVPDNGKYELKLEGRGNRVDMTKYLLAAK